MRRRRILLIAAVATVLDSVLIGLVTNPASSEMHWPVPFDWLRVHAWESLGLLTIIAAVLAILVAAPPDRGSPPPDLRTAADTLADAIRREWEYETRRWRILDPYPLPVRWIPADSSLTADWPDLVRLAKATPGKSSTLGGDWAAGPRQLAGGGDGLSRVLHLVPTHRLVVLGQAGGGKTILLVRLVLDLLSERRPGDPVPIIFPLASWDPGQEDLDSWIVRSLTTTRVGLARPAGQDMKASLARVLLDAGLILPVLDGLDEIPDALRGTAVARINDAMRPGQWLVVATRTDAYKSVVQPTSGVTIELSGAAGIELCPLRPTEVAEYLKASAGGPKGAARWERVVAGLATDRPSAVAQALSTPLMASLARAVYNPRPGEGVEHLQRDPAELLNASRFPDRTSIEHHLFDHFISSSYRPHPDPAHPSQKYRWPAEKAERWLIYLARNMELRQNGITDFMWWRLPRTMPKHLVGLTLCLALGTVAAVGYPFVGFGLGILLGLPVGLLVRKWLHGSEVRITHGLAGGLLGGVIAGIIALAAMGLGSNDFLAARIIPDGLGVGIAAAPLGKFAPGFAAGFVASISAAFYQYSLEFQELRTSIGPGSHLLNGIGIGLAAFLTVELASRRVPAKGLRWSPVWFACTVGSGILLGMAVWITSGRIAGLTTIAAGTFGGALVGGLGEAVTVDLSKAVHPTRVMRRDRHTFVASFVGFGLAIALGTGLGTGFRLGPTGRPAGIQVGLEVGLTNFLVTGIGLGFVQAAWGQFIVTNWWLALRRKQPWRLMTFLHDASTNRGVLRQFGGAYQFRHIEVQRRIGRSA